MRVFLGDDDFIFQCSAPRRPMNYEHLLEHFHDAREAAGLNDVTFHALRHTFASILIAPVIRKSRPALGEAG
jgi:integrase